MSAVREESPVSPLAEERARNEWGNDRHDHDFDRDQRDHDFDRDQREIKNEPNDPNDHNDQNNNEPNDQNHSDEDNNNLDDDPSSLLKISEENWQTAIDPTKPASEVIPYLELFAKQNIALKKEIEVFKQKLRESNSTHRGSLVTMHNKMFKRLLDAEEERENESEDKEKKVIELEKKVQNYEEIYKSGDVNKSLQDFLTKEQEYLNKIQQLERRVKQLEDELKIERMKVEEEDRERRKSIATLHNRMFKRFLHAEEQRDELITGLKSRIQELEREVIYLKNKNQPSAVATNPVSSDMSFDTNDITPHNLHEDHLLPHHREDNYDREHFDELRHRVKYLELQNATLADNTSTNQEKTESDGTKRRKSKSEDAEENQGQGQEHGDDDEIKMLRDTVKRLQEEKKNFK